MQRSDFRYIIGVDEVGRGPLAGPVSVGAVMLPSTYDRRLLRGVRDSKKMTSREREFFAARAKEAASRGELHYAVSSVSAGIVDRYGIVSAVRTALRRAIYKLDARPEECLVLLDGGLRAPKEFLHQETIIRGEDHEPAIALASVIAKVHRDKKMVRLSKQFPGYAFDEHKGYGTKKHRESVAALGMCGLHRRSFIH